MRITLPGARGNGKRRILRPHRNVVLLFLALVFLSISVQAAERKVLIFSSTDPHLPAARIIEDTIRSKFGQKTDDRFEFFNESLEHSRIQTEKFEKEFVDLLRVKYEGVKFDCIFALGSLSVQFLAEHQDQLFGNTPVIFVSQDDREVARFPFRSNMTGAMGKFLLSPSLELMLAQHRDTKTVVVVSGKSEVDRFFREQAQNEFAAYAGRVEFKYVTDVTLDELKIELASLSDDHIIYFLAFMRDRDGRSLTIPETLAYVAPTASVPIYGTTDTALGLGIVGGNLLSFEALGENAAGIGLRIIAGEMPSAVPPVTVPSRTMFDWREMQRWKMDENRLPAGSIVRFRQPTAWEEYRPHIIAASAVGIIQSFFIVWLLIAQGRRRKAEGERNKFQALALSEAGRLDEVVTNVPGIVWESRVVDETGRRKVQFVSGYVEEMLGYSVEECLADPEFIISRIVEEDVENYKKEADLVMDTGGPRTVQFRCTTKNGGRKWAEVRMVAIRDESGQSVGLRGVTMDITERKKAEDDLIGKERQLVEAQRLAQFGNWEWDQASDTVMWSEEIFRIYGLDPTQPAPTFRDHVRLLEPESLERLQLEVANTLQTGEPYEIEIQLKRSDGSHAWGSARGELVRDGGAVKLRGTLQDITARKHAEETIRESEARFRNMADTAPTFIWLADSEMHFVYFNRTLREFAGLPLNKMLNNGWLDHVHPEDFARCVDTYAKGAKAREPFVLDYRLRRADGEYRWIYDRGEPRLAPNGEFLGYIGSAVDVTDRIAAQESLKTALDQISQLKNELQEENVYLKEEIKLIHNFDEIIGSSEALKYVLFKIEQVAPTNTTVLISGETGTGKELVARAIHSNSNRKNRPLVKVNCAALGANFIESELFGHEKGSFTGASAKRIGRFELADGGTIFLDEIGELPMDLQVKLLRILQEGEFERLGSSRTIKIDVRVIAATNRDLRAEVQKGNFREDLLFRLNVFPITVPPLRERADDIPLLVNFFVSRFSKQLGKQVTAIAPSAMRTLSGHSWPGNVRELANVIERSIIGTKGDTLKNIEAFESAAESNGFSLSKDTLETMERKYIAEILNSTAWRIEGEVGAAKILGLNPSTLRTRMNKLGISRKPDQHNGINSHPRKSAQITS